MGTRVDTTRAAHAHDATGTAAVSGPQAPLSLSLPLSDSISNTQDTRGPRGLVHTQDVLCHRPSVGRVGPRPRLLRSECRVPSSSLGILQPSSSSWLSQWKMHLYLANADIIGLFKIPEDFNCRKSLKFKSFIVFFFFFFCS